MDNKRKKISRDVYRKRQKVLLFFIGFILVLIIVLVMYIILFSDQKKISHEKNTLISDKNSVDDAVLADAKEGTLDNSNISFKNDSIQIKIGNKTTPEILNGSIDSLINWESSDSSVAVVSENGEITGVNLGICAITASVKDSGKLLNLRVDVVEDDSEPEDEDTIGNDTTDNGYEIEIKDGITYI